MEIRRFEVGEAEEVQALVHRGLLEVNIKDYTQSAMEDFAAYYDLDKIRRIAAEGHMYVAVDNGKIVGTGTITAAGCREGERMIYTLFLLPEYVGKGLGRAIVETLKKDELWASAERILLDASKSANFFYEHMGFRYQNGVKTLIADDHYPMEYFNTPGISEKSEAQKAIDEVKAGARVAVRELLEASNLSAGQILVVGCSSSEILAHKIGTCSSADIGRAAAETILEELRGKEIYLAAQCCEHLNRCLIVEEACAKAYGLPVVNAVPKLKAGGSFATACYEMFEKPVAVEEIKADAGIDIGDTFIGMHLRPVAVPVRMSIREIGAAHVTAARTRLKFIGGARTSYL